MLEERQECTGLLRVQARHQCWSRIVRVQVRVGWARRGSGLEVDHQIFLCCRDGQTLERLCQVHLNVKLDPIEVKDKFGFPANHLHAARKGGVLLWSAAVGTRHTCTGLQSIPADIEGKGRVHKSSC